MLIGKKIFPYPTLNRNLDLSGYDNSRFYIKMCENSILTTDKHVILKDVCYHLENETIQELIDKNQAKCVMVIDCSASIFRKTYDITSEKKDVKIAIDKLKGQVFVSAYIFLLEDIADFKNNDFNEDFRGYSFGLSKFDIVAIDDGFRFRTEIDESNDNKVSSIFTIVRKDDNTDIMTYDSTSNKIIINLSPKYFDIYNKMKNQPQFNNVFFSMIIIPVLSNCLKEIQSEVCDMEELDDLNDSKLWFKSVMYGYQKATNQMLTMQKFKDSNALELSQIVMNKGTCASIEDFYDIIQNGFKESSEGDEDE